MKINRIKEVLDEKVYLRHGWQRNRIRVLIQLIRMYTIVLNRL